MGKIFLISEIIFQYICLLIFFSTDQTTNSALIATRLFRTRTTTTPTTTEILSNTDYNMLILYFIEKGITFDFTNMSSISTSKSPLISVFPVNTDDATLQTSLQQFTGI